MSMKLPWIEIGKDTVDGVVYYTSALNMPGGVIVRTEMYQGSQSCAVDSVYVPGSWWRDDATAFVDVPPGLWLELTEKKS